MLVTSASMMGYWPIETKQSIRATVVGNFVVGKHETMAHFSLSPLCKTLLIFVHFNYNLQHHNCSLVSFE